MKAVLKIVTIAVLPVTLALLLSGQIAHAQDPNVPAPASPSADGKSKIEVIGEATEEDFVPRKAFTRAERQAICRRHEGKLIAYYSEIYKVIGCVRRPILSNKTVYGLMRSGKPVLDVDGDVIAAIREGEPLDLAISIETARGCKQLEGKYVTFSSVDVYLVERCQKRLFPDWTTYTTHRQRRGDIKGEILSLSLVEFEQLADGKPIPSVVDDMFAKLLKGEAQVDVIPVDEACHGVNGKVVSYYSRLYKVESCRKREIMDPEQFFRGVGGAAMKITELRSEQWLSLPDGRNIENAKPAGKPRAPVR